MKKKEYKELLASWVSQLRFSNLCQDHLKQVICEIDSITEDPTIKLIIKNWLERHDINKYIHARKIFTSYW